MKDPISTEAIKGRGTPDLPPNRFERVELSLDPDVCDELPEAPKTQVYADHARTAIAYNNSPDLPFSASLNPYRGCEHGCVYCYARPTHEYFGLSAGLDFETKIFAKLEVATLLRRELSSRGWSPQTLSISGVTDCYQPIERQLKLTRSCLEVLAEYRNPTAIITKNALVCRDIDILLELNKYQAVAVFVSVTTLDPDLCAVLEPRTSRPPKRLETIAQLSQAGIPTGVMVAPVIPGLTDHEMMRIVVAAAKAGARTAGYVPLRLPFAVKDLFETWLTRHYPDAKNKVLGRIRDMRGGKLNDSSFENRMSGKGPFAIQMKQMFQLACRRAGFKEREIHLSTDAFRRLDPGQMALF